MNNYPYLEFGEHIGHAQESLKEALEYLGEMFEDELGRPVASGHYSDAVTWIDAVTTLLDEMPSGLKADIEADSKAFARDDDRNDALSY